MKKFFYNSKGFNTLRITIESFKNKFELYYHLNDNPIQHIWQEIHKDSKKFKMGVSHATDIELLISKLNNLYKKLNRNLISPPITQEKLNELHHEVVSLEGSSSDWADVNRLIHAMESRLEERLSSYKQSIVFYKDPDDKTIPILDEYKLWLTSDRKWGRLLLGYGTLGKDWIDIAADDDNIDDLSIQTTISSEGLMIFNIEYPFAFGDVRNFYQWGKQSKFDIPFSNLNKLSLGNYLLGEIIITDVFLNFHPVPSDWYVTNHKCKFDWGKHILGNNPKIIKLDFFDSDIYFDTLLKHSKLNV